MNIASGFLGRSVVFAAVAVAVAVTAAGASAAPLAYTANYEGNSVSVIDTATNAVVGKPIPVGAAPSSVAVTPDGKRAYVTNFGSNNVSVIDTATGEPLAGTIKVGEGPQSIAISPDGQTAYVADLLGNEVTAIDTRTDAVVGQAKGLDKPISIAVAPDGRSVWVADEGDNSVSVLDSRTLKPIGEPIPVGDRPAVIAFSPDGKSAYVSAYADEEVAVIDTATRVVGGFQTGSGPWGLAITPDGKKLFVADQEVGTVEAIDLRSGRSDTIEVGSEPHELALAPNGKVLYVTDYGSEGVRAIDTQTDKVVGNPIKLAGLRPLAMAVTPDQSPTAAFTAPSATVGAPAIFSGAASTDPDGSVVSWNWAFGDGGTGTGVSASHTFGQAGTFGTKLSVVDNEGCGEAQVFTGRTAYCSGNVGAGITHPVTVAPAPAAEPIAAPAPPSNAFRFGRVVHNLRNGTVRIQVMLPSAGFILLFGKKVHAVTRKSKGVQTMWLTLHARVELAKRLKTTLRAPVRFRLTFTPNGGTPKTVHRSVTLLRAPRHKH